MSSESNFIKNKIEDLNNQIQQQYYLLNIFEKLDRIQLCDSENKSFKCDQCNCWKNDNVFSKYMENDK